MLCLCSVIKLWHQYSRYKPVTAMNSFYSSSGNGLVLFMLSFVRFLAIAGMQNFDHPEIQLPRIDDVVSGLEPADVHY